jgi:thiol-disulfide isomerase/thioredoxin
MRGVPQGALTLAWAVGVLLPGSGCGETREKYFNSYLGKTPPELVTESSHWINAPSPLKLADQTGKVVWLEFGSLGCACCRDMDPVLRNWQASLAPKGLVIIGVDSGKEDALEAVKDQLKDTEQKHAVLWDAQDHNGAAYGIQGYPVGYLIGVNGKVLWEGAPCMKAKEIENLISMELGRARKAVP